MNQKEDVLELRRAAVHIVVIPLAVFSAVYFFGPGIFLYAPPIIAVALVVFLFGEFLRMKFEYFQIIAVDWFGKFMSPEEKALPPKSPKLSSASPMLVGLLLASSLLSVWRFIFTVVTLSVADPSARILGLSYGKVIKLPWAPKKSAVGFMTVWAIAAIVSRVCGLGSACVIWVGLLIAVAESIGRRDHWYMDDNLLVPVFALIGFYLL